MPTGDLPARLQIALQSVVSVLIVLMGVGIYSLVPTLEEEQVSGVVTSSSDTSVRQARSARSSKTPFVPISARSMIKPSDEKRAEIEERNRKAQQKKLRDLRIDLMLRAEKNVEVRQLRNDEYSQEQREKLREKFYEEFLGAGQYPGLSTELRS